MTPARSALITASSALVGLIGAEYEALVASVEVAEGQLARADEIAIMSGCELVWHALVRAVFADLDALPYVTGAAFEDFSRIAGAAKRVATLATAPQPGDAIEWGASGSAEAHVDACVESVVWLGSASGAAFRLTVIAGGQRRTAAELAAGEPGVLGEETVKRIERTVSWMGGRWVDVHTGRAILAVCDGDVMAELYAPRG